MASTFSGLQIGKSGLTTAQIALNITGQNISNADTAGYTRQKVTISSVEAVGGGYIINQITNSSNVGQGVSIVSIDQIRSSYLDEQYRDAVSDLNNSTYRTQGLTYLQDIMDELDTDGTLTTSISDYFAALTTFANDTTSETYRTSVQQTAEAMTGNFNAIFDEMVSLYNDQNESISTNANEINDLASQIASLNNVIAEYESSGQTANDLRDDRNNLLDELSGYVDYTYSEDSGGMVNIQVAGETLVDGTTSNEIDVTTATDEINSICSQLASLNSDITASSGITSDQEDQRDSLLSTLAALSDKISYTVNSDGTAEATINDSETLVSGSTATAVTSDSVVEYDGADDKYILKLGDTYLNTDTLESGELCAHLNLRDNNTSSNSGIPYYIDQLNGLAQSIAEACNEIMNTGYTYPDDENGNTSETGVDLFNDFDDDYSAITAGNFSLSSAVEESVWNIAGSSEEIDLDSTSGSTNASNNEVASALAALIDTSDFNSTLNTVATHLGQMLSTSTSKLDTQQSLTDSIDQQRASISGVSLDEEATNLIMYQQAYNACSRVITTMDEMLDRMINAMGKVGL